MLRILGAPHDAKTGFHDIKPPPLFAPFPWVAVAVAVCLLLAVIGWWWWRRRPRSIPVVSTLAPVEEALAQIAALETARLAGKFTVREFASELSLALRRYFEREFHFPATDATVREVVRRLPEYFAGRYSPPQAGEFARATEEQLRLLEYLTFSEEAEQRFPHSSAEVASRAPAATELIKQLVVVTVKQADHEATP